MQRFFPFRFSLIALIAILIIASFFRLYNIAETPPGLYPDEAMNGNNLLESLVTGEFKVFYPENNGREGLFMNLQALSVAAFGNEPWALRVVSAIFGILTVLGVYYLARELFSRHFERSEESRDPSANPQDDHLWRYRIFSGEAIALLSAFFLATSFWHINFSRIGFRAIMAPFFLTWGLYFFLKALRRLDHSKFYIPNSILSGIFLGLGFYSYIAYRQMILLAPLAAALWWWNKSNWNARKKIFLALLLTTVTTIFIVAPLGMYYFENPQDFFGRTSQISVFSSPSPAKDLTLNVVKTIGMFFVAGDYNWRHNYAGKPELFWPVAIAFAIGIIIGLKKIYQLVIPAYEPPAGRQAGNPADPSLRRDNKSRLDSRFRGNDNVGTFIILFAWLFLAALPVVISNEGLPHALRAIIMIPPAMILAGYGAVWIIEKLKTTLMSLLRTQESSLDSLPAGRQADPAFADAASGRQVRNGRNKNFVIFSLSFFILIFAFYIAYDAYRTYFVDWAYRQEVQGAFAADYVKIGRGLNSLPRELPKYVIVEAGGTDVRGIPMPAQTVMFITDTFLPEKQREKNIFYILPREKDQIPRGSYSTIIR
ncbi:glycosyltransferase family 39 protein [Candidatus Wolfebacteria bacterium]|nr:glycosyltransferase family 39 protein [Candidatus Wolfebacteria bacterium]